ncbi:MAG: hypothetical protein AAB425_15530 [Bdellovibrionota bacterium]
MRGKPVSQQNLEVVGNSEAFFYERVVEALGRHRIGVMPETEAYLVKLLSQFMFTENLYGRDGDGNLRDESLVNRLKEAIDEQQGELQRLLFRQIGDVSLYTAGFFQDSLNRKLVDVEYYIDMGGQAYRNVASRAEAENWRNLYLELATKFSAFVEVLADISQATAPKTEQDLLRIYENWVRTRSTRAEKTLKEAGIIPNANIKKDWQ